MHPHRLGISDRLEWSDYIRYGNIVREVMVRISSPCSVTRLFYSAIDPLALLLPNWLYVLIHTPDPAPIEYGKVLVDPELIISAVLAGIMGQMVQAFPSRAQSNRENIAQEMDSIISKGISRGLERTTQAYRDRLNESMKFINTMQERSQQSIRGSRANQQKTG